MMHPPEARSTSSLLTFTIGAIALPFRDLNQLLILLSLIIARDTVCTDMLVVLIDLNIFR